MCGGGGGGSLGAIAGGILAPAIAIALAPETGGASLAMLAAGGAAAGSAMVDKPQAQAQQALQAQQTAQTQATAVADKQATLAEQQINQANAKTPDVGAMLSANQQAAKSGGSGTMLTGPSGVDPTSLNLGRTTLLGS